MGKLFTQKLVSLLLAAAFLLSLIVFQTHASEEYWPTAGFKTSTPEMQGMDSDAILKGLQAIQKDKANVHSLLIIRNGYLVTEAYFNPYNKDSLNTVFSVTKSFTSALTGIAIKEGYIKGVDQKILEFFPQYESVITDQRVKDITIDHLLTHRTGFSEATMYSIEGGDDIVKSFLSAKLTEDPGKTFVYNEAGPHMLTAILQKATGKKVFDYAKEKLFTPIGIKSAVWDTDDRGIHMGGHGLHLTSFDMAKLGYLYLKKGIWNGKEIVPEKWVQESTTSHVQLTNSPNYGYYWWKNSFDGVRADGLYGQNIFVLPETNMVIVFTSSFNYSEKKQPANYVEEFFIPAAKSSGSITENKKAQDSLKSFLKTIGTPKAAAPKSLPKTAYDISGKTYKVNDSFLAYKSFTFTFNSKNTSECTLKITQGKTAYTVKVGLDGVFRTNKNVKGLGWAEYFSYFRPVHLKGRWIDSGNFEMTWLYDGGPTRTTYTFTFDGKNMDVELCEYLDRNNPYYDFSCTRK